MFSEILENYCDNLLGIHRDKGKKKVSYTKSETPQKQTVNNYGNLQIEKSHHAQFTEDGFKIVGSVPSDDSDISDAFECDSDEEVGEERNKTYNTDRYTEDGFKIISEIPSDDSDISDAFTSDVEEDYNENAENVANRVRLAKETKQESSSRNKNMCSHVKNISKKKAIGQLINDFNIRESSDLNDDQQDNLLTTCETYASKLKQLNRREINIIDVNKKRKEMENSIDGQNALSVKKRSKTVPSKKDEMEFKNIAHDVFKFGLKKFDKNERQQEKIALAVKLGAKPPKQKAVNYKIFMKKKKEEGVTKMKEKEIARKTGTLILPKKKNLKKVSTKKSNRSSIIKIKKRDFKRINSKK